MTDPCYLDFTFLIRMSDLDWDEVAEILIWEKIYPQLKDYFVLPELSFPPFIYKLNLRNKSFIVHIGAARLIAKILNLNFSDRCVNVLAEQAVKVFRQRGVRITNAAAIENLRYRVEAFGEIDYDVDEVVRQVVEVERELACIQYDEAAGLTGGLFD